MGASSVAIKSVIVIGLVMALMSQLFPGSNAGWYTFNQTLANGPNTPSFQSVNPNPTTWLTLLPQANGSFAPTGTFGCPLSAYYQCLQHPGNPLTYVWIDGIGKVNFSFKLGTGVGYNQNLQISSYQMHLIAKQTPDTGKPIAGGTIGVYTSWNTSFNGVYTWPGPFVPSSWTDLYINGTSELGFTLGQIQAMPNVLIFEGSTFNLSVAYFEFKIGLSDTQKCSGLGFSDTFYCLIGGLGKAVVSFIVNLGAGIVWFFATLGGLILYGIQLIGGVLIGLAVSFLYFFNLPGCPTWLQYVVDALMGAFAFSIILLLLDYFTGFAGGTVNKA